MPTIGFHLKSSRVNTGFEEAPKIDTRLSKITRVGLNSLKCVAKLFAMPVVSVFKWTVSLHLFLLKPIFWLTSCIGMKFFGKKEVSSTTAQFDDRKREKQDASIQVEDRVSPTRVDFGCQTEDVLPSSKKDAASDPIEFPFEVGINASTQTERETTTATTQTENQRGIECGCQTQDVLVASKKDAALDPIKLPIERSRAVSTQTQDEPAALPDLIADEPRDPPSTVVRISHQEEAIDEEEALRLLDSYAGAIPRNEPVPTATTSSAKRSRLFALGQGLFSGVRRAYNALSDLVIYQPQNVITAPTEENPIEVEDDEVSTITVEDDIVAPEPEIDEDLPPLNIEDEPAPADHDDGDLEPDQYHQEAGVPQPAPIPARPQKPYKKIRDSEVRRLLAEAQPLIEGLPAKRPVRAPQRYNP